MSRRKREEAPEAENHERWIVSYADMLTLLFALFVVLYSTSDANPAKLEQVRTSLDRAFQIGVLTSSDGASPIFEGGGGLTPSIAEIRSSDLVQISRELRPFADGADGVQVRSDGTDITISLADNLLFGSASAALQPGSQEVLDDIAALLAEMPNRIRVEGHTDNIPVNTEEHPTNWELSSSRANTVVRYLVDQGGLEASRLSAASFADTRPLGDNDTPEGRALNRRADIVVIYPTAEDLRDITIPSDPED